MLNLKRNTKIVFGIYLMLYLISGFISIFDLRSHFSSFLCTILTISISISAFYIMVRALLLAHKIEKAPHWYSNCCCRSSAIQVVIGFAIYMFLLGLLKSWSVSDLFIYHWTTLPLSYNAQSWAYLAQNATAILLSWVVLDVFEAKYKCAQVIKRHTCDERAIERVEEVDKCETKVFR